MSDVGQHVINVYSIFALSYRNPVTIDVYVTCYEQWIVLFYTGLNFSLDNFAEQGIYYFISGYILYDITNLAPLSCNSASNLLSLVIGNTFLLKI